MGNDYKNKIKTITEKRKHFTSLWYGLSLWRYRNCWFVCMMNSFLPIFISAICSTLCFLSVMNLWYSKSLIFIMLTQIAIEPPLTYTLIIWLLQCCCIIIHTPGYKDIFSSVRGLCNNFYCLLPVLLSKIVVFPFSFLVLHLAYLYL